MSIETSIRKIAERFESANLFYGHGTDNAFDEAAALVFHVLNLPFDIDQATLDQAIITTMQQQRIQELVQIRIKTRKPLSYLIQTAYFAGLPFYVDERVIVPRSPFAELIENQFEPWVQPDRIKHILDLCTGSGCMAIACAKYFPDAEVDAIDVCQDALAVAAINIKKHEVENQVHLFQSNLFDALPHKKRYDLIISNPPYVSQQEMQQLPKEYLHEPSLALAAGKEGLDIVNRILREADYFLSENGTLFVEVGNTQEILEKHYPLIPFTWLTLDRGGDGIFLLSKKELTRYAGSFKNLDK